MEIEGLSDCIRLRKDKLLGKEVDESQVRHQKSHMPLTIPELEKIKKHVETILPIKEFKDFDDAQDAEKRPEAEQRLEQLLE